MPNRKVSEYVCMCLLKVSKQHSNNWKLQNCSGNCKNNSLFLMLAYQAIQIEDIYVYIYIYIYSNDFCLSRKSASEFEGK